MFKFFTYEERLTLQKLLKEDLSFKKIAAHLQKDPSTISREGMKEVSLMKGKSANIKRLPRTASV